MAKKNKNRNKNKNKNIPIENGGVTAPPQKKKNKNKDKKKDKNKNKSVKPTQLLQKTLKEVYGPQRISHELVFKDTLELVNDQIIPYCIIPKGTESIAKDSFNKLIHQLSHSKIITNLGDFTLQSKCVEFIDKAMEIVCVSSFLLQDNSPVCDALYRASKRGVRVYLLLASEKQIAEYQENEADERVQEHIKFLNDSVGFMVVRCGEFHAKYLLVDPHVSNTFGLLFTANLTQRALTENKEIGVLLDANETRALFRHFLFGFWVQRLHEYTFNPTTKTATLASLAEVRGELPVSSTDSGIIWTSKDTKTISRAIEEILQTLREEDDLLLSTWNFSLNTPISERLLSVTNRHTKVLLPARESNHDAICQFLDKGAEVRCNYLQHAKFIITPKKAIIFSANFEPRGLEVGFEAGIVLENPAEIGLLRTIFSIWFDYAETVVQSQRPISTLVGQTITLLRDDKTSSNVSTNILTITADQQGTTRKHTWPVQKFVSVTQSHAINLEKELRETGPIILIPYSLKTRIPVEIHAQSVPENVSYVKSIEGFHIWQDNAGQKQPQRYLVLDKNPLENPKIFEKGLEIAKSEGIVCVLY